MRATVVTGEDDQRALGEAARRQRRFDAADRVIQAPDHGEIGALDVPERRVDRVVILASRLEGRVGRAVGEVGKEGLSCIRPRLDERQGFIGDRVGQIARFHDGHAVARDRGGTTAPLIPDVRLPEQLMAVLDNVRRVLRRIQRERFIKTVLLLESESAGVVVIAIAKMPLAEEAGLQPAAASVSASVTSLCGRPWRAMASALG